MQRTSLACLAVAGLLLALNAHAGTFSYDEYESVLTERVDATGFVDYAGLARDRGHLDTFTGRLADLDRSTYQDWSRDQQLAFWMNAYNALTLKAVVDHYPVKSIKDIGNVFVSVWDKLQFDVMGEQMTLNHIEHEILRKQFSEPRIHMAINCASIGCPPLADRPLRADTLDAQFDALTQAFLGTPAKFKIDRARNAVHLSPIFKWFGDDFVKAYGGKHQHAGIGAKESAVLNFIAEYVSAADRAYLRDGSFKVKYLGYDWKLNRQ